MTKFEITIPNYNEDFEILEAKLKVLCVEYDAEIITIYDD